MMRGAVDEFLGANPEFKDWKKEIELESKKEYHLILRSNDNKYCYTIDGLRDKNFDKNIWFGEPGFPSNPDRVEHKFKSVNLTPAFLSYLHENLKG